MPVSHKAVVYQRFEVRCKICAKKCSFHCVDCCNYSREFHWRLQVCGPGAGKDCINHHIVGEYIIFLCDVFRQIWSVPPVGRADFCPTGGSQGLCSCEVRVWEATRARERASESERVTNASLRAALHSQNRQSRTQTPLMQHVRSIGIAESGCEADGCCAGSRRKRAAYEPHDPGPENAAELEEAVVVGAHESRSLWLMHALPYLRPTLAFSFPRRTRPLFCHTPGQDLGSRPT